MSTLVALDPSINTCGLAVFEDGQLERIRTVTIQIRCTARDILDRCSTMAECCLHALHGLEVNVFVSEWPQVYTGTHAAPAKDQIGMAGVASGVATSLVEHNPPCLEVRAISPAEWTRGIPKAKTGDPTDSPRARRIMARLSPAERKVWTGSGKLTHDAIDAVGIGLYALGRLHPKRNFEGAV